MPRRGAAAALCMTVSLVLPPQGEIARAQDGRADAPGRQAAATLFTSGAEFARGPAARANESRLRAAQRANSRAAARKLQESHPGRWYARWRTGGDAVRVLTSGAVRIGSGSRPLEEDGAIALARDFLTDHAELLNVPDDGLRIAFARRVGDRWTIAFDQTHAGRRVVGGRAVLIVSERGELVQARSDLVRDFGPSTPSLTSGAARGAAEIALNARRAPDGLDQEPILVWLPEDTEDGRSASLAYRVRVVSESGLRTVFVAAGSGVVLREGSAFPGFLSGQSDAMVSELPTTPPAQCGGVSEQVAVPHVNIEFASPTVTSTTDATGVLQEASITSPSEFRTSLAGPYVETVVGTNFDPAGCIQSHGMSGSCPFGPTVAPADPALGLSVLFDDTNSHSFARSAYLWANEAHDWVAAIDATDPGSTFVVDVLDQPSREMSNPQPGPVRLLLDGAGAFGLPLGYNPNAFEIGLDSITPHPVPGIGLLLPRNHFAEQHQVVLHEYGHFVWDALLGYPDPSLTVDGPEGNGEAFSEVFAALQLRQPLIGTEWYPECGSRWIRSIDNRLTKPFDDGTPVVDGRGGEYWGGFAWDLWKELDPTLTDPSHYATVTDLFYFGFKLVGPFLGKDFVRGFFVRDDNDGDPATLSPNGAALCKVARLRGVHDIADEYFCPGATFEFESSSVELQAWIPLDGVNLNSFKTGARKVAGYSAPNGSEFAIQVVKPSSTGPTTADRTLRFIDLSDPNYSVVDEITTATGGNESLDALVVVGDFAVLTGTAKGIVVDLTTLGSGSLATAEYPSLTGQHGAVSPDGTRLYLGQTGTVQAFDISNLSLSAAPQSVGSYSAAVSDIETGPNDVVFLFHSGAVEAVDWSTAASPQPLGGDFSYPNAGSAVQGTLASDRPLLFLSDAADDWIKPDSFPSTTYVLDVSNPSDPIYRGQISTDLPMSENHFQSVGRYLYEANHVGGLRILSTDLLNGGEVGAFLSFPSFPLPYGLVTNFGIFANERDLNLAEDGAQFVDATLPSGRVLVSDRSRGLFVLDPTEAVISIDGISPALATAGTEIVIEGAGFHGDATVTFGGVAGLNVVVEDFWTVRVEVPAGITGPVDVRVDNVADGTSVTEVDGFAPPGVACDLNFDGAANVADLLLAKRAVAGDLELSTAQEARADVAPLAAPDGEVNGGDLLLMKLGLQGTGPCGL